MNRVQSKAFNVQKCCERIWNKYRASSFTSSNGLLERLRLQNENEIVALPEFKARVTLSDFLASGGASTSNNSIVPIIPPSNGYKHVLTPAQMRLTLDAAIATFHLHVESRIAALCGQGFYTIGPCGEEMLASIGWALDPYSDAVALHYRHLSVSILRQLRLGRNLEDVILDRARGHVVSKLDPVTGGVRPAIFFKILSLLQYLITNLTLMLMFPSIFHKVHCAIGSAKFTNNDEQDRKHVIIGSGDYVVTSTLASQCPPAVGRALGFSMVEALRSCDDDDDSDRNTTRPISFVTIGDGSVHNAHFLSAFNLTRHARFRRKKCPVVFGVSDNGLSISYATDGYADYLFSQCSDQHENGGSFNDVRIFKANGCDMMDVYDKTLQASAYSRKYSAPSLILYQELTRRFGHAATDRQHAYLDADDIASMAESDVVASGIVQAVNWNGITYGEAHARFEEIGNMVSIQFLLVPTAHLAILSITFEIAGSSVGTRLNILSILRQKSQRLLVAMRCLIEYHNIWYRYRSYQVKSCDQH
jgi:hypothetical protein